MPLREGLLDPISGDNPSGKNMKYDRVFDQVKEARTEEDNTLPSGAWERQAKRADSKLVVKLAGEALATKTKDLQLAVWLGEAYIKMEGAGMVHPVLTLLFDLQKTFWDTIYPEIDEGDAGLRAVPLQWAANRYAGLVYDLPLTKSGINYHSYKAGRAVGYEADAENNEAKTKARQEAVKRGNLTSEDVDEGVAGTPKNFYAALDEQLQGSREVLDDLAIYCEEQYGEDGPSYRKLRDSLDEVHNLVNSLLADKRALEPDSVAAEPEPEPVPEPVAAAPVAVAPAAPVTPPPAAAPVTAAPTAAAAPRGGMAAPQSWDDASTAVQSLAAYMHGERPGSAVPYLLHTAIRWGELRRVGPVPSPEVLTAPSSELRSGLKLAFAEKTWSELLTRSMAALKDDSARTWLDVHRYLWAATKEMGYQAFATMIVTAVRGLLFEYPRLPTLTFMDDTPLANVETQQWIEETVLSGEQLAQPAPIAAAPQPVAPTPIAIQIPVAAQDGPPDAFLEAASLAAGGQLGAATALLARDAAQQSSGRMRYSRRMQIAELCLAGGNAGVATPILRELIEEMERRNLESWESGELITKPIALLLRSQNGSMEQVERDALFTRLCRLDPSAALDIK